MCVCLERQSHSSVPTTQYTHTQRHDHTRRVSTVQPRTATGSKPTLESMRDSRLQTHTHTAPNWQQTKFSLHTMTDSFSKLGYSHDQRVQSLFCLKGKGLAFVWSLLGSTESEMGFLNHSIPSSALSSFLLHAATESKIDLSPFRMIQHIIHYTIYIIHHTILNIQTLAYTVH